MEEIGCHFKFEKIIGKINKESIIKIKSYFKKHFDL